MTYKAIMNKNRYTICHAGPLIIDASGRAHVPAGSPGGGQFTFKPDAYTVRNVNTPYEGYDGSGQRASGGSASSSGPTNYSRENPYNLTNDELKERNTRAQLLNNYEKNYGSTQQDIEKFTKISNELVDKGAAFAKKIAPTEARTQLDLSRMTNQELNDYINRARLEQQYNDYYNPPKPDKTRDYIDMAATGLGLLISSAGVAASIIVPIALAKKKGG